MGAYDLALVEILRQMRAWGVPPAAGGILDQDPELLELLWTIQGSLWWRQVETIRA